MNTTVEVVRPVKLPRDAPVELGHTTLGKRPAWTWAIRSLDGHLIAFGIQATREQAIARALDRFPAARPPEPWDRQETT